MGTARDDSDSVVDGNLVEETADEARTAATTLTSQYSSLTTAAVSVDSARDDESDSNVDENLVEGTADEATTVATAETTLSVQESSSTTDNSATKWSTTTVHADMTTESQNSTLPPPTEQPFPSKQPPSDKPKSWADIFCDKVKQFFNFMGHKITDTVSFIKRLFHWLY